ncbi:hypothetical protein GCK72_004451 [Caenorhabditis remanei]|uniref:G-protein coupled receptors family 1 profile domain-containing protein n=1 Tax=Caenorhabditis remanei TaxID=31234 RepID=A0A6A5HDP9_CAERE|nr:hypothetical protein GCK72_004451 [Caenorhabditis remanei]KAF1764503.1 hypothetical protein GCK72_004451 [Caenorhabditis remanei]
MNYSSFPPIITYSNSCASPFEMDERTSHASRLNVYVHNVTIVLTFLMMHMAIKKLLTKKLFSTTTRNLLFYCMIYYVVHDIYFICTMNWSFYRSITRSDDSCRIMFHGSECYFLYIMGVFFRVLLPISQIAITVERIIVNFLPNSDLINPAILNTMTIILSVITTSKIKPSTHSEFNSPNCFQQMYPDMPTTRSLITLMVVFDVFCFPVNFLIMIRNRKKFNDLRDSHEYNLKSRYANKTNMYAAMSVSFVSFIQTLIYTVYISSLLITLKMFVTENGLFYGNNVALWFYTFPLAGFALPCSILLSFCSLSMKKKNKIGVIKTTNSYATQDAYFRSLAHQWGSATSSRMSIA